MICAITYFIEDLLQKDYNAFSFVHCLGFFSLINYLESPWQYKIKIFKCVQDFLAFKQKTALRHWPKIVNTNYSTISVHVAMIKRNWNRMIGYCFFLCRKYWPIWAGVFIGNFSVYSATRFWTVLHSSGFTPNKCVLFDWLNYWTVPRGDGKPRNKQEMNGDCLRYISPRSRLPERVPRLLSKQDFFFSLFFPSSLPF